MSAAPVLPGDLLATSARARPTAVALVHDGRSFTYADLAERADRVAGWLQAHGVRPGDRVTVYAPNSAAWVQAYHGILRSGAVVNPVNAMLTTSELAYVLDDCGARVLCTTAAVLAALDGAVLSRLWAVVVLDELPSDLRAEGVEVVGLEDVVAVGRAASPVALGPEDPAVIGYTSGTTGHPKGAVQSQGAVLLNWRLSAEAHGKTAADVVVTALPAPHVYGSVVLNGTFGTGGTVVLMSRFGARAAMDLVAEYRATLFEGVPAMYAMMLADPGLDPADLATLTRCTVGGQTMAVSTMTAWERASGAPLIELWGMTELSGLGTTHPLGTERVHGSIGRPLPGMEARVADLDRPEVEAAVDRPGELWMRGPLVMTEYFGRPDATAEVLAGGWLRTGDLVRRDAEGDLWVVDRCRDLIISGGYNVYPAEIERVLSGHPAVALVAVGPVPDEVKGEVARAYVVLRDGHRATEEELIACARAELAAYKTPRSVVFVPALPQTSSGKIMRRMLRELPVAEEPGAR